MPLQHLPRCDPSKIQIQIQSNTHLPQTKNRTPNLSYKFWNVEEKTYRKANHKGNLKMGPIGSGPIEGPSQSFQTVVDLDGAQNQTLLSLDHT